MSLQGLISGAECAVEVNPLSQVLKHADGDRSLQQLHHLPSTSAHVPVQQDMAIARQFFEQGSRLGSIPGNSMAMSDVARQLELMAATRESASDFSFAWSEIQRAQERQAAVRAGMPSMAWTGEFESAHGAIMPVHVGPMAQQPGGAPTPFVPRSVYGNSSFMYSGMGTLSQSYISPMSSTPLTAQDKGKGKLKDSDFEAAFAQFDMPLQASTPQESRIEEVTSELEKTTLDDTSTADSVSFKDVWDQMKNSDMPPSDSEMAKWESEFNHLMRGGDEDYDYDGVMREVWENEHERENALKFDDEGIPALSPYVFEKNNPYLDPSSSTQNPLQAAKDLIACNGSLTEAGLLLEAAIWKGELGIGGYEAWILLGETRNMDEREEAGLRALTEGVRIATEAGAAGEGMISLAISYTNEGYERASHTMLLRWLRARFPTADISPETADSLKQSAWHSHGLVTDALLGVARSQHAQGIVDADTQIALGVLFYTDGKFDLAKDCFETALAERPGDYLLWNRLGSSLSNGNKPEESLGAYRQALSLRPTYTRAIYNVGVACLNIGAHKEAVEHFLSALALQESTGDRSEQLLTTLRRTFGMMRRNDLVDLVKPDVNIEVFRKEGFDF
ncbi:peroxisome targeting signal receptor [Vararia minispora EC-137]|uniref:Peroxisome targeting signal receptor n=1 Tax=Vararia minispora EC-137 TaxID=1314806 RepID=A0ACB8QDC5_9AGAM|nr:peroxisome targeting signal receptor [Vararia minispora EC-137]